ncbi:MAG: peptide chain release factor N(5)-glutamine methyltransferase [Clostridium sp.]|nr:peptide chain release factor N(5)-glutamine methyltransferase [Clostridium sp.]
MTYREAYELGVRRLSESGIAEAKTDARLLLEHVCHTDYQTLYTQGERVLDELQIEFYVNYLQKRAEHIPLQYLTHTQSFMGLDFYVNKNTLIPRADTEILVEEVMRYMQDGMAILDLCTGSGCILLSLLHYSNGCFGVGTDVSGDALAVARENADALGFEEKRKRGELLFLQGDLYDALGGGAEGAWEGARRNEQNVAEGGAEGALRNVPQRMTEDVSKKAAFADDAQKRSIPAFDVIVSNPPYIRSDVIPTLMPEVKEHEPRLALDGGGDGLSFYRRIIDGAPAFAKRESALFFEIGADQGDAVKTLMQQAGYYDVRVVKDYAGLDRVVYGVRFAE